MISVYLLLDFFSAYRLFVPLGMFFYAIREKNRTFA